MTLGVVAAILVDGRSGGWPVRALRTLSVPELLALAVSAGTLALGLVTIGWRTVAESWLPAHGRGRLLWAAVVGAGGFLGWAYAATVTFMASMTATAQIALAFTLGGLPFALVAALLLRPLWTNVTSAGVIAIALASGLLVAASGPIGVVAHGALLLQLLLGPTLVPL